MARTTSTIVRFVLLAVITFAAGCANTGTAQQAASLITGSTSITRTIRTESPVGSVVFTPSQVVNQSGVGQVASVQLPDGVSVFGESSDSVVSADDSWTRGGGSTDSTTVEPQTSSGTEVQSVLNGSYDPLPGSLETQNPEGGATSSLITAGPASTVSSTEQTPGDLTASIVNAGDSSDLSSTSFTGEGVSGSW